MVLATVVFAAGSPRLHIPRLTLSQRLRAFVVLCFTVVFLTTVPLTGAAFAASSSSAVLPALRQQAESDTQSFLQALVPERRAQLRSAAEALVTRLLAAPSMARRLAGSDNWQPLAAPQKEALSQEMARTVTRYLLEVADVYSQQTVSITALTALSVNRVQMQMILHGVPGREQVPVMLDWVRAGDEWRIADFSVEGISYAATKRWQYQVLWQQGGFGRYYQHLKDKNDEFFSTWLAVPRVDAMSAPNSPGSPD